MKIINLAFILSILLLSGCQAAYYNTMEKFGVEKREILVDRVDDARDSQEKAAVQFESALEEFIALTGYNGGDLQEQYDNLTRAYQQSEEQAATVRSRIASVENVAQALFREWKTEIKEYTDQNLKRKSEAQLKLTQARYEQLLITMHKADKSMDPVLAAFKDRVLFLKHNLNARALDSLKGEALTVQGDVSHLVNNMKASINQSDLFIKDMR